MTTTFRIYEDDGDHSNEVAVFDDYHQAKQGLIDITTRTDNHPDADYQIIEVDEDSEDYFVNYFDVWNSATGWCAQ